MRNKEAWMYSLTSISCKMQGMACSWGGRVVRSRECAVTTVWLLPWVLYLENPQVIWVHLRREQCFYRCSLRARLYLWKCSFWVCFNTICPLKNGSKAISTCNPITSTSWINPAYFMICCSLFGLFLLNPLIIRISLCFYKTFPDPKLDLQYTFLQTHHVTLSLNHILLLLLSFPLFFCHY